MRWLVVIVMFLGALTACTETPEQNSADTEEKTIPPSEANALVNDSIEVIIKDSKTGKEQRQMVSKDIITRPSTIKQPKETSIEK